MNYKIHYNTLKKHIAERNHALLVIVVLFMLLLLQSMLMLDLVNRRAMHFTPLPPVIHSPFSISRDRVSDSYLSDMTRYFAMLRLNYTPASLPEQTKLLLRYTDAKFYGALKEELAKENKQAQQHDVSLYFAPVQTAVSAKQLTVFISGDLTRFVGKARLPTERVRYRVQYHYYDGVLRITSFQQQEKPHG